MNDLTATRQVSRWKMIPAVLTLLCTSMFVGCGASKELGLETFPVSGQVLINGVPPVRAEIRLRPKVPLKDPYKRSVEPYAFVESDGMFHVSTYRTKDGAPPGEYAVTIVWPVVTVEGGEEVIGPDRLGRRFSDPNSPVTTFQVIDRSNLIPTIDLKL